MKLNAFLFGLAAWIITLFVAWSLANAQTVEINGVRATPTVHGTPEPTYTIAVVEKDEGLPNIISFMWNDGWFGKLLLIVNFVMLLGGVFIFWPLTR